MSLRDKEDLRRALRQKQIDPLYLLFGGESYLRDLAAKAITEEVLRNAPLREFNESSYSLLNTDVQQAIAAAEQLPMMSGRRVVRVSDFTKLNEADEAALVRYVSRPVESSVVIFVADDLDKRRRLTKTLIDACVAVEFAPLTDAELGVWAKGRLKDLKVETDERTLHHIVALVGSDVRLLSNELEKLATAAADTGFITMKMVDELVGRARTLSNFELTDHLISRDRKRSLQILRRLLDDGAEPVMLIGLIASNYHRLALAKELMSRQAGKDEVFRLVSMPFSKREDFLATARRSDAKALARSLERIAAADLAIKTSLGGGGASGARLQLEMLVCELSA
ncbi:MAG: DNA polymerase III subunit delta [Acidobacteria bacterium 13_1_20CM_3_53_8]|nr:MAG: DNA polymerase III subunit delta [Acidobacteria bacterium 13_1_20CM_3_53_8]